MNGAKSTFMRMGYWLTALAAAVLLAASPGTALAQSVGFVGSSSTMMEGASPDAMTPAPITVDINVSGLTAPSDGEDGDLDKWSWGCSRSCTTQTSLQYPGKARTQVCAWPTWRRIWLDSKSSAVDEDKLMGDLCHGVYQARRRRQGNLYGVAPGRHNSLRQQRRHQAGDHRSRRRRQLAGQQVHHRPAGAKANGVSPSPGSHTVTVTDTDPQPTVSFSRTSIALTEGTQTTDGNPVTITVGVGMGSTEPAGISANSHEQDPVHDLS